MKKIPILQNEISKYGADMNLLLTYYHFEDDWKDEKSLKGIAGIHFYKKQAKKICKEYPRQSCVICKRLRELAVYEQKGETDIDLVAGTFGHLMEELFVLKKDRWEPYLRKFGFFLEHLPCVEESQIIKNIIYSGVWSNYNKIQKEKQEKEKNVK